MSNKLNNRNYIKFHLEESERFSKFIKSKINELNGHSNSFIFTSKYSYIFDYLKFLFMEMETISLSSYWIWYIIIIIWCNWVIEHWPCFIKSSKSSKPAGRLKIIVDELEEHHSLKTEVFIDNNTINTLVNKGWAHHQDFKHRIDKLRMKMIEAKDLREAAFINELLQREENHFKEVYSEFKWILGFFGQPTSSQSSQSSPSSSDPSKEHDVADKPDIFDNKNTGFFNDPNKDESGKKW